MARRPGQHQHVRKDSRHSEFALDRRALVKGALASGAGLAATAVFAPAVHAAKTLKLGYVSPQTGPLAAFAEADNFVDRETSRSSSGPAASRSAARASRSRSWSRTRPVESRRAPPTWRAELIVSRTRST